MSDDTLLAHLASQLGRGSENLATEALAYVLRHPQVADAFRRHLRLFAPELPDLVRFRTQVTGDEDSGIRDLVGSTTENTTPLVVEVKFDAPLTSNQPHTYLRALAELTVPSLLLFLVPTARVEPLWPRLQLRCADEGLPIVETVVGRPIGTHGNVTLAISTWERLLDDLSGIPLSETNQQVLAELLQLRGLCERQDRDGWLPLDREFLEGDVGRHLLDLDGLLISAVNHLRRLGAAETARYKWSAGQGFFGKYFGLAGRSALLHVNFRRWGTQADTPLWLQMWSHGDPRVADALSFLANADPRQLFDDDGKLMIPVRLQPGADRDECLDRTVQTVLCVYDALKTLPPIEGSDPEDEAIEDAIVDADEA